MLTLDLQQTVLRYIKRNFVMRRITFESLFKIQMIVRKDDLLTKFTNKNYLSVKLMVWCPYNMSLKMRKLEKKK